MSSDTIGYSSPGDVIHFTFQIYSGNKVFSTITIGNGSIGGVNSAPAITNVNCTGFGGNVFETLTCTGSYTALATDAGPLGFAPHFRATGINAPVSRNWGAAALTVYFTPPPPRVDSVTPSGGSVAGGNTVIVTGQYFSNSGYNAQDVQFGGVSGSIVSVDSDTQITVMPPPHATGAVQVSVTTPYNLYFTGPTNNLIIEPHVHMGTSASAIYTYIFPPTISESFSPPRVGLNGNAALKFSIANPNAGAALSGVGFNLNLPAGLVVATPNNVSNSCGGAVSAVAGNGSISFTGGALSASASCSAQVDVTGSTAGVKTALTSVVTAQESGNGLTATANLTVLQPPTASLSFAPTVVPQNGSSKLTVNIDNSNTSNLTGINFTNALPAGLVISNPPNVVSNCGGSLTANSGAGVISLTGVTILSNELCEISLDVNSATAAIYQDSVTVNDTEAGSSFATSASLTVKPRPTVTAIAPATGPIAGGTVVTVTGTGFDTTIANDVVKFGTVAGTVTAATTTSLTVTAPVAAAAGVVDVTVQTTVGTSAVGAAGRFTYTPPPAISSISPTFGPATGGTTVTILGDGFTGATGVTIGGTPATFHFVSDESITVVTPPGNLGQADVIVAGPGGSNLSNKIFRYVAPPPTITSITPASGDFASLTTVTVVGTGFDATTTMTVGGNSATPIIVAVDGKSFMTNVPAGTVGAQSVVVTTTAGTASSTFTYLARQNVTTSVSLSQSTAVIGQTVTATYTFTNPNVFSGIVRADMIRLPTGLIVATPPNVQNNCGGSVEITAAATTFNWNGTDFSSNSSCKFTIDLVGQSAGNYSVPAGLPVVSANQGSVGVTSGADAPLVVTIPVPAALASATPNTAVQGQSNLIVALVGTNTHFAQGISAVTFGAGISVNALTITDFSHATANITVATNVAVASSDVTVTTANEVVTLSNGFTVSKDSRATPTVVVTSNSPVCYPNGANQFTFTITVTGAGPTPTGSGRLILDRISNAGFTNAREITPFTLANGKSRLTGTCTTGPSDAVGNVVYDGDSNYQSGKSASITQSVTVLRAQTITFTNLLAQNLGTTPTLSASATSRLPVSFTSTTPSVCTITSDGVLTTVAVGDCTIRADQIGNATYYLAAPTVSQTFSIKPGAPGAPIIGTATAGNGQATVTFTPPSSNGGAAITSYTVSSSPGGFSASGTTSPLTVMGLTNGVPVSFTVFAINSAGPGQISTPSNVVTPLATQTITFDNPGPQTYVNGGTFNVSAIASSGFPVAFSVLPASVNVCSVVANKVSITAAGTCSLQADQGGQFNYAAAPSVQQNITINKAAQTVSFTSTAPTSAAAGDLYTPVFIGGASTSPIVASIDATSTAVCSLDHSKLFLNSFGTCLIDLNQAGDGNYNAATQVQQSITVGKGKTQTALTLDAAPNLFFGTPQTFRASLTWASTPPASGTIQILDGSTVLATLTTLGSASFTTSTLALGPHTVTAVYSGDANNLTSTSTATSLTIAPLMNTITFTQPLDVTFGAVPAALVASATSGVAVGFTSTTPLICSVLGSAVTLVSGGTCIITASQGATGNYAAASDVSRSFKILQGAQTITFPAIAPVTYAPNKTFAVAATGGASGNAVTFASTTTGICTVSASTVSIKSAGTCNITADQLGNASYTAAPQVSQNIVIGKAAQSVLFTSAVPTKPIVSGNYTPTASGGASTSLVVISLDASSGANVCSIDGAHKVTFLKAGTCLIDADQAGDGNYSAAVTVQQTIAVQDAVGPTTQAIGRYIATYDNQIISNLFDMDRTIDRLEQAGDGGNIQQGGFAETPNTSGPRSSLGLESRSLASPIGGQGGVMLPVLGAGDVSPKTATADAYGIQQMLYGALRQLGETQSVTSLNYSGPFDAQMNIAGNVTGSFHTSLNQIMKWDDQRRQKDAASLGIKTSGQSAHAFMPLDIWMQGSYSAVTSTQTGTFGQISTGVDYVLNRNLLLGVFGQVDFLNQTSGLNANGTGWLAGPYGTLRLTDHMFLEARGGYGRSSNSMTNALSPSLTDQFNSTRWLGSAALAGRWQLDDNLSFKPSLSFTYFTDTTDAYVNALAVPIPSVNNQLGQVKLSPEVSKGFTLSDGNAFEASLAPQLIYNFTSTSVAGLGNLDPTATGPTGLRAAIKGGLTYRTHNGLSISTTGSYDGIGSNGYSAITGSAKLTVPLN